MPRNHRSGWATFSSPAPAAAPPCAPSRSTSAACPFTAPGRSSGRPCNRSPAVMARSSSFCRCSEPPRLRTLEGVPKMRRVFLPILLLLAMPLTAAGVSVRYADAAIDIDGATPRGQLAVIGYGRYLEPDRTERRNEIEKLLTADDSRHLRVDGLNTSGPTVFLIGDMTRRASETSV